MLEIFRRFVDDEGGATAIEYGVIAALIFLAIIGAVTAFATNATGLFFRIRDAMVP